MTDSGPAPLQKKHIRDGWADRAKCPINRAKGKASNEMSIDSCTIWAMSVLAGSTANSAYSQRFGLH